MVSQLRRFWPAGNWVRSGGGQDARLTFLVTGHGMKKLMEKFANPRKYRPLVHSKKRHPRPWRQRCLFCA